LDPRPGSGRNQVERIESAARLTLFEIALDLRHVLVTWAKQATGHALAREKA